MHPYYIDFGGDTLEYQLREPTPFYTLELHPQNLLHNAAQKKLTLTTP
jgi:hypothetical protein